LQIVICFIIRDGCVYLKQFRNRNNLCTYLYFIAIAG
jgi:hypothetical protein